MTQEAKETVSKPRSNQRIAVFGAGIAGLSAAKRLLEKAPGAEVCVWERADRVGGIIGTRIVDGFLCETSVDNFITTVPEGIDLCKELGFQDELQSTNNRFRRTLVVRKGRLHALPDGFMTMAPTKLYPMITTPLLSPLGKLRCGLELFLPRRRSTEDESLAAFAQRRLGKEAFDRIIEPLVGGIYGGDAAKLSLKATLPRFAEMEEKSRSLIWAMTKTRRAAKRVKREEESGARYSFFITLSSGMQSLPERLADRIGRERIALNRAVAFVEKTADGGWLATDGQGQTERFDAVIFATDSTSAARALADAAPEVANIYGQTDHTGVAIVHLAYRDEQIGRPVKGMGFVVPTSEGTGVIAGSFSSYKYPTRAPEGTTLLRIFVGGARAPEMVSLPESKLVAHVESEARKLLGVEGAPIMVDVARFPNSMPQYYLGRLDWREQLRKALDAEPTLELAGNALNGVGLPACIKSGYDAAERIV
ncbi:MAG: protoporphyrinogen oxidase [Thermoguttaceae bacterium]|jgi:oxygen-dependent protoporphyrinogen oxidase